MLPALKSRSRRRLLLSRDVFLSNLAQPAHVVSIEQEIVYHCRRLALALSLAVDGPFFSFDGERVGLAAAGAIKHAHPDPLALVAMPWPQLLEIAEILRFHPSLQFILSCVRDQQQRLRLVTP